MNKRQQEQFIHFFQQLMVGQRQADKLKWALHQVNGFNPTSLFQKISQQNDRISIAQMRSYLSQQISVTHREIYDIFEKFDSKRLGYISQQDFIRELSPFKLQRTKEYRAGTVNSKICSFFVEIVVEIQKSFRIVEQARKQIVFILPYNAFAHLDAWKKGVIGIGEIQKFYRDNQFQITRQQAEFLLHALRRRFFRQVNLQLFCQNLNPLQFGEYPNFSEQIRKQNQGEFLRRSRRQQQEFKRSRIQNQKYQFQAQKGQRRRRAQIQRQLNIEQRINLQLVSYDKQHENNVRRALLQDQRDIRNRSVVDGELSYQVDYVRDQQESVRLAELEAVRQRERQLNQNLELVLARQQAALLGPQKKHQQDKDLAIQQQIQRDRQTQRLIYRQRQLQMTRPQYQPDVLRERQSRMRQIQRQRQRNYQPNYQSASKSIKQSRIDELQQQLTKTRAQMRERRNIMELQDKMRLNQTSAKSRLSAFPY